MGGLCRSPPPGSGEGAGDPKKASFKGKLPWSSSTEAPPTCFNCFTFEPTSAVKNHVFHYFLSKNCIMMLLCMRVKIIKIQLWLFFFPQCVSTVYCVQSVHVQQQHCHCRCTQILLDHSPLIFFCCVPVGWRSAQHVQISGWVRGNKKNT